ncbi:MAG: Gfo/Idh/MocA family protein [Pirellulaceae bacterium]
MFTRRTWLRTAALLSTIPLTGNRTSRAAAANDRLAVGFIGVGTMGRGHLGALLRNNGVQVVAVSDVVEERRANAANMIEEHYRDRRKSGDFRGVQSTVDFREILARDDVDAVVVATPDHWHSIPCILAARAGKHIYCEKPLTHHVAEGRRLVDEVRRAGIRFQTGSQQRSEFEGRFRKAVEYIWNGRIGRVHTIRIGVGGPARPCDLPTQEIPAGTDWDRWLGPAPERGYHQDLCPKGIHKHFPAWRSYQEYAGGALADMGAHHFDIAQWALRMDGSGPVEIQPSTGQRDRRERGLRFVYANGVVMIHNEFEGDLRADCLFEGTDGKILVSRNLLASDPASILEQPLEESAERVYPSLNHRQNWLDCIRSGEHCICPAEVGHRSATICHLGNIGYRLQRSLKWDPAAERFVDDAEANQHLSREPRGGWQI